MLRTVVSVCRGEVCLRRKQLPEAEAHFRTAIGRLADDRHSFTVPILMRLASTCLKQGMLDEAEVAIRHGLRRVRAIPTSTSALREMKLLLFFARVAEKRRDWSGLEQIGQELFALARSRGYYWSPVRTNAGRYLGLAAMHKGQYEKAVP